MRLLVILSAILFLGSCATKIPYTTKIQQDFDLTPEKLKKVQFYTSEVIILTRSDDQQVVSTTGDDGELVSSERSTSERIVIGANVPCIFESMEDDGTVNIRFETGPGRVLRFKARQNDPDGPYFLVAQWKDGKGELDYGGAVYFAQRSSASAYLLVKLKKWKRNQRKDRYVKGMKI